MRDAAEYVDIYRAMTEHPDWSDQEVATLVASVSMTSLTIALNGTDDPTGAV